MVLKKNIKSDTCCPVYLTHYPKREYSSCLNAFFLKGSQHRRRFFSNSIIQLRNGKTPLYYLWNLFIHNFDWKYYSIKESIPGFTIVMVPYAYFQGPCLPHKTRETCIYNNKLFPTRKWISLNLFSFQRLLRKKLFCWL